MKKIKSVLIIAILLFSMFFVLNTVSGQAYPRIQWYLKMWV
ncbi:MAG TPA: hypothetical protein PLI06_01185 [Methanofastidiosum sp.]|nr:hypothetical protein [Methanofastidiosum sp.]